MTGRAWLFNLDVEREFAARGSYQPKRSTLQAVALNIPRIARDLLHADDVLLSNIEQPGAPRAQRVDGLLGVAWCPTTSALRRLGAAGALLPAAPSMDVLRRVNAKDFACEIETSTPLERSLALDLDQVRRILARPLDVDAEGRADWLIRRRFGAAGHGAKRMRAPLQANDLDWLARGLELGPLVCEPRVGITAEFTTHGQLDAGGNLELGEPCVQVTSPRGAWLETRRVRPGELGAAEREALASAAERTAEALLVAGYFGPFGLDAYRFERNGRPFFQPLSDLNARYTTGWAVGMAGT